MSPASPAAERPANTINAREVAKMIWPFLRPQAWSLAGLGLALVVGVGLQLWGPQIIKAFIDEVSVRGSAAPLSDLWTIAGLYLVVTVIAQLVRLAGAYFSADVGWGAANRLRADLLVRILRLDSAFHDRRSPGELIERADGDVSAMVSVFSQFLFQILGSTLLLIGIVVVLGVKSLLVAAALSAFAVCAFVIIHLTRGLGVERFAAERQARSSLSAFVEERVSGLDDIRANGGANHITQVLGGLNKDVTRTGMSAISRSAIYIVLVTNGVFVTGYLIALFIGIYLYRGGFGTLGTIYLLMQYATMMRAPLESIGAQMQELQRALGSLSRIGEIQNARSEILDGPGVAWTAGPRAIAFDKVSFRYSAAASPANDALREISFALPAGRTLGIVGRTGSGKTTLVRLLCRLYDPTSGHIRLDGHDIRSARLDQLRGQIGVVTQEVETLEATVRDNLTLFDPEIDDPTLVGILHELGLAPWLARQSAGLDTMLTSGGGDLSAGESQLLAFARVFVRSPGLVVLDEASSRLDPSAERVTEVALDRLLTGDPTRGGRRPTLVIVAHRLATLRRADLIMILEDGEIVEFGEQSVLAGDPSSRFAGMLKVGMERVLS
jgi:ATP-binding cassette subfamily B protein